MNKKFLIPLSSSSYRASLPDFFVYISVSKFSLEGCFFPFLRVLQGSHDLSKIIINDFAVLSSDSSLEHAPKNATDLMLAWKPLLNLIIICHFSGEAGNLQNQQIMAVIG